MGDKKKDNNFPIINLIFNILTAVIAIIAMTSTRDSAKEQLEQSRTQFETILKRDSLLSIKEEEIIAKNLEIAILQNEIFEKQNIILDKSFNTDSKIQSKRLKIASIELQSKTLERKRKQEINLNKLNNFLVDFILHIKMPLNNFNKLSREETAN